MGALPAADSPPATDCARKQREIQLTWLAWAVFYVAVCAAFFLQGNDRPVNNAYAEGADRWMARCDLYEGGGGGFIYFPQSAILYSAFRRLPFAAEQISWRLVSVGLFSLGIFRLARLAGHERCAATFGLTTLLVLPKAWNCACNGQATLAMTGLSMLALAEIPARRWWRSTGYVLAALAFKPLAIVLILLLAALHRPLLARIAAGIALFWLLPYCIGDAGYVNSQYRAMLHMLDEAAAVGLSSDWAQLFSLCTLAGFAITPPWQTWLRLMAAVGTLLLCRRSCRTELDTLGTSSRSPDRRVFPSPAWLDVLALSTAYLLLFNPRTENNSYVMLSPILGFQFARARLVDDRKVRTALLAGAAFAIVAGHEFCGWLTPNAGFIWLCPLVCLIHTIDCLVGVIRKSSWTHTSLETIEGPITVNLAPPAMRARTFDRSNLTDAA